MERFIRMGWFAFLMMGIALSTCRKNLGNIPQVKFVKAEPDRVSLNNVIRFFADEDKVLSLEYAFQDNNGDVAGMTLTKIVQNRSQMKDGKKFELKMEVSWPGVPVQKRQKGDINLLLSYIEIGGPRIAREDDTVQFALQLRDAANHLSDTAFSHNIIILRTGSRP